MPIIQNNLTVEEIIDKIDPESEQAVLSLLSPIGRILHVQDVVIKQLRKNDLADLYDLNNLIIEPHSYKKHAFWIIGAKHKTRKQYDFYTFDLTKMRFINDIKNIKFNDIDKEIRNRKKMNL